jgi:ABC-type polysaccharide/polyol phosphate transport system ATPase subunit
MSRKLPPEVVVSFQDVTRLTEPAPEPPEWLARFLPKAGLAGHGAKMPDFEDSDEDEDLDELGEDISEEALRVRVKDFSYDLHAGAGLGVLSTGTSGGTIVQMLMGLLPPTSGRILIRGRVAPLVRDVHQFLDVSSGRSAVFLVAKFLGWPRELLRKRWDQIVQFADLSDFEHMPWRDRSVNETHRLLVSAALQIDANLYVIDRETVRTHRAFGEKVLDVLEERKRDGAAIVYVSRKRVEEVARLCEEVVLFEEGVVTAQGTPLEVAPAAERESKEPIHRGLVVPLVASLPGDDSLVRLDPDGGLIEFDLEVLRKDLQVVLSIAFENDLGRKQRIEQPGVFRAHDPGKYRLRVRVPEGALEEDRYRATLLARDAGLEDKPGEEHPVRKLLDFDVVYEAEVDEPYPEIEPELERIFDEEDEETSEVEWVVSRVGD